MTTKHVVVSKESKWTIRNNSGANVPCKLLNPTKGKNIKKMLELGVCMHVDVDGGSLLVCVLT